MKIKPLTLKWVIVIAIITLIVGALVGSNFNLFGTSPSVTIYSDELKFVGNNNGAIEYKYVPNQEPKLNTSIKAYFKDEVIECKFAKISTTESEYGFVCEPEN